MHINKFRLFRNTDFILGKYITVFSGTNAVGKSTLLGILGNSSELKVKYGRPILQKQFRTEFSEIFKMSQNYDPTQSNVLSIFFDDGDLRTCRITWQKDNRKESPIDSKPSKRLRPRIIPEYIDPEQKKRHSQKKNWPTLFLGLSRLYPLGESDTQNIVRKKYVDEYPELTKNRNNAYITILSLLDEIKETSTIPIEETSRKQVVGITTSTYDYLTNSAGQDNLGQILLAVDSFRILKQNYQQYNGGLLLIDEIDATLHPSAQNRLFDYLFKSAKDLDLQIAFTTHSLSLLFYITQKTAHNSESESNNIELYYMSIANDFSHVQTLRNPPYYSIRALLLEQPSINTHYKIGILSEDEEARWFIKNILDGTALKDCFELLPTKIGKNSIISLIKGDPYYATSRIFIFDGDIPKDISTLNEIKKLQDNKLYHLLILPGGKSPEQLILEFLKNDSEYVDSYYNQDKCILFGLTKSAVVFNSVDSQTEQNRESYKKWFNKYERFFDETNLFHFYKLQNEAEINEFYKKLTKAYNALTGKMIVPPV